MSEHPGAVVELDDVHRTYPGGVAAVRGVSLRLEPGEQVAILGPSGSGKSTLLNLMGTLDRPSSGRVRVDGYDIGTMSERELAALRCHRIGFVFQQFHLPPGVPARDAVADALLYRGVPPRRRRALADEPTGSLDTRSGEEVMRLLHGLHERGTAVVVITHNPEVAAELPRHVEVRDGKIVADQARAA